MKITIDVTEEELKEAFYEKLENAIDHSYLQGDEYEKALDFIIAHASPGNGRAVEDDARPYIIADVLSKLLERFKLTKERVQLLEDGIFDCATLADILDDSWYYYYSTEKHRFAITRGINDIFDECDASQADIQAMKKDIADVLTKHLKPNFDVIEYLNDVERTVDEESKKPKDTH